MQEDRGVQAQGRLCGRTQENEYGKFWEKAVYKIPMDWPERSI